MMKYMALVLALAGCAVTHARGYEWVGRDVALGKYNCERDVRQSGYFGSTAQYEMLMFFAQCMRVHGYRLVYADTGAAVTGRPDPFALDRAR